MQICKTPVVVAFIIHEICFNITHMSVLFYKNMRDIVKLSTIHVQFPPNARLNFSNSVVLLFRKAFINYAYIM